MLHLIADYKGALTVNGKDFANIDEAIKAFSDYQGQLTISIKPTVVEPKVDKVFKVTVRQYMTKPATPEFDFHTKWNNDTPMPMRTMVGKIVQETKGMFKMELHGDITEKVTDHCLVCGKKLTNPVSKYFGVGPECGNHSYINPFETEAQLKQAVAEVRKQLQNVMWNGWIIKSAIENMEELI